jgi:hypothetical protein
MYAGALGDNAVKRYALFLTSLVLSTDPTERRTALQCACEHGLDVPQVAIVTAEHTIERSLDNLGSYVTDRSRCVVRSFEDAGLDFLIRKDMHCTGSYRAEDG